MSMNLRKVANVFDAMAGYIDAVESEKQAAATQASKARVDKVASAHANAHGEEIPDDIRHKLAATDPSVLAYVENVLAKQAGVVDSLGAPAANADDDPPSTIKEAADAADKRFFNWLVS
jgi:hypothetical protein